MPDPQLLKALLDAAGRGVDVRLILPSESDSNSAFYAGRSHYSKLLEGGVKIYERRGALLHVKAAIVDGVWSCVGSSRLHTLGTSRIPTRSTSRPGRAGRCCCG